MTKMRKWSWRRRRGRIVRRRRGTSLFYWGNPKKRKVEEVSLFEETKDHTLEILDPIPSISSPQWKTVGRWL